MSTMTVDSTPGPALRTRNKVGLVLALLLGLGDLVGPFTVPAPTAGENGPPMAVLWACAVLGLITVVAVVWTWRSGSRLGARVIAAARVLSALSSLPAFFAPGVPAGLVVLVAVGIAVTALSVSLILSRPAGSIAQPSR